MEFWILVFLTIYVGVSVLAYFIQEYFIFKPEKLAQDFEYKYDVPFEELFFDVEKGVRINGLHFKLKNPSGLVIYFHGNTRSIKGWSKYSRDFTRNNYNVVMIDYRGYGKSTGKRSEKALFRDSQFVYNQMRNLFPEEKIVIYGRSLGSGFATKLASKNEPKMLILDAPYYSMSQLTSRFLFFLPLSIILRFHIRTDIWIKYVKCPIYIIHGTKDRLIPFRSSVKLQREAPLRTRLVPIHGGRHNNLPEHAEYHNHLDEILQEKYDLIFDKSLYDYLDYI